MAVGIRRLGPGDEEVLRRLSVDDARYAEDDAEPNDYPPLAPDDADAFLANDANVLLVALDGDDCVGFVLGQVLQRRHGDPTQLFVYEIGVARERRHEGIGRLLMERLFELARGRGIRRAFVLTNTRNERAVAFYRAVGGTLSDPDDVMFRFDLGSR